MKTAILTCALLLAGSPALAQISPYVGVTAGVDAGGRGPIDVGAIPTLGGVVGIRLSRGWSIEADVDRGFGSNERTSEGLWIVAAGRDATPEERQRSEIHARFVRTDTAGLGWSAVAVWRSQSQSRLDAAFFGGISSRRFTKRTQITVTSVGPDVPPGDPNAHDNDTIDTLVGGGLAGGVMLLVKATPSVTIAPEFRYTAGIITDESTYSVARVAVKALWRF